VEFACRTIVIVFPSLTIPRLYRPAALKAYKGAYSKIPVFIYLQLRGESSLNFSAR
jgi:hypothetical protein